MTIHYGYSLAFLHLFNKRYQYYAGFINRCQCFMLSSIQPHLLHIFYIYIWVTIATNYKLHVLSNHNLRNNHIIACISSLSPLHTKYISFLPHSACPFVLKPHIPNVNYLTISLLLSTTSSDNEDRSEKKIIN